MSVKISVIIHTLNEEKNIRNCLESVKWADEIILVDMYSDDKTVEIAREYTDRIFMYERMSYADPARQFALEQASNEWVLIVDADEMVTKQLSEKLKQFVSEDKCDGVFIPRSNYFFGHLMQGANWGSLQDAQLRFHKKSCVHFSGAIHTGPSVDPSARIYTLRDTACAFVHFNYIDPEQFIEKLNRYTTIEANLAFKNGRRIGGYWAAFQMVREIGVRFFLKRGYKDGLQGFLLAVLMGMYRASTVLKLHIIERYGTKDLRDKILDEYQAVAVEVMEEYRQ